MDLGAIQKPSLESFPNICIAVPCPSFRRKTRRNTYLVTKISILLVNQTGEQRICEVLGVELEARGLSVCDCLLVAMPPSRLMEKAS